MNHNPLFFLKHPALHVADQIFSPPLFLAPMAGITHSAFRRLVADYGGYGALYTEMIPGRFILSQQVERFPIGKIRPCEGPVIVQLLLNGDEDSVAIVEKINRLRPAALDINCGCPAPQVAGKGGGFGLFSDIPRLKETVERFRKAWDGPLLIKCRLMGKNNEWRTEIKERLTLLRDLGVDAVTVHPRFAHEKLKRRARHEWFDECATLAAPLPLIASGDITGPRDVDTPALRNVAGVMIGRHAAVKPWIFREMHNESVAVDYGEVWERFCRYVCEDFDERRGLGRIKEFTTYFARNFMFGHDLYRAVRSAPDVTTCRARAATFFAGLPAIVSQPSVAGI